MGDSAKALGSFWATAGRPILTHGGFSKGTWLFLGDCRAAYSHTWGIQQRHLALSGRLQGGLFSHMRASAKALGSFWATAGRPILTHAGFSKGTWLFLGDCRAAYSHTCGL